MKPLASLDASRIHTVLLDIDDTLTTDGRLEAPAYAALASLKEAGKRVVPITGRPAGWCDHIARMWPVDAVVGENGAFYFHLSRGKLHKRYQDDAATRAGKRGRLQAIADRILGEVPGCALASDQGYRETDLAIDYCEDVAPLPLAAAERIAQLMRQAGLTAKISSIHVNGWFGEHDKESGARWIVRRLVGRDLEAERARWLYVGDSTNDQRMFECFPLSAGVANLLQFAEQLVVWPAYITRGERGAGFAEIAKTLVAARA
jgi:HAD superfamily hydrolase (TIGR01484 family)